MQDYKVMRHNHRVAAVDEGRLQALSTRTVAAVMPQRTKQRSNSGDRTSRTIAARLESTTLAGDPWLPPRPAGN